MLIVPVLTFIQVKLDFNFFPKYPFVMRDTRRNVFCRGVQYIFLMFEKNTLKCVINV